MTSLLVPLCVLLGFAAPATSASVVTVNGVVIDQALVRLEVSSDPAARYHSLSPEKQPKYEADALERLIDRELMLAEAVSRGLAPSDVTVDAQMQSVAAAAGGDERFALRLAENSLTLQRYREWVRAKLAQAALEEAVRAAVTVRTADVSERYAAQASEFVKPASAEVRMLYFRVMPFAPTAAVDAALASAVTAANEWRAGGEPEALAKRLGARFVEMGVVHEGAAIEGLEEAIAAAAPNSVTGPVKSVFGYHVLRIGERTAARQLTLEEVRPQVEAALRAKRGGAAVDELRRRLRAAARIVMHEK